MAGQRQADGHRHGKETTGKTLKRRGILAAAGAVVAGIVAKQTSQPVAAHDANDLGLGSAFTNTASTTTKLSYVGLVPPHSAILTATDGGNEPTTSHPAALAGFALQNPDPVVNVGVYGATSSSSADATGVRGEHFTNGIGVQGSSGGDTSTNDTGFPVGVQGGVLNSGTGVYGKAGNGTGVYGLSTFGNGVTGIGGVIGVRGQVSSNSANTIAVQGINQSTGVGGAAVSGASTGGYGVLGQSAAVGFAGITGITTTANVPAFAGGSTTPSALAARFNGGVYVDCTSAAGGQFVVNPMSAKSGLLKHPDGSHRLMYSVEAPESWAEDFGGGALTGGRAEVKIDPDFAAIIRGEDYRVFLTPEGDCRGLFVTNKTPAGFEVRELQGGMSAIAFQYRIVARPKVENHTATRLAKYDLPVPLHIPSKDELAKVLDVPAPPQPTGVANLPSPPSSSSPSPSAAPAPNPLPQARP